MISYINRLKCINTKKQIERQRDRQTADKKVNKNLT